MTSDPPGKRRKRRRYLILALLVALVILGRWVVLPWWLERHLKQQFESRFRGEVSLEDLDLDLLAGRLTIRGLRYQDPSGQQVLSLASGTVHFTLASLLDTRPRPTRLDLTGVRLHVVLTPKGSNVEENYRPSSPTETPVEEAPPFLPQLVFEDCEVVFEAPLALHEDLTLRVQGEVLPSGLDRDTAQVHLRIEALRGEDRPGEDLEPVHLRGRFNARTTAFKLSTDNQGVKLVPALRDMLNPHLARTGWDWLAPSGSVRVEVEGDFHRVDGLPSYRISLFNAEGLALCIKDFPYAVRDLQGVSLILPGETGRRGRLTLDNLRGTHGRAIASVSGDVYGFLEPDSDPWVHLVLEGRDVPLDEDLKLALEKVDPEFGKIWEAISPAGSADFQCLLYQANTDPRVSAAITATVRNGAFNYLGFTSKGTGLREGFPYPLSQVTGSFESQLAYSRFDFVGRGAGRSDIHVTGEVRAPGREDGRPLLEIQIHGRDVPLDDALRRAMLDVDGAGIWKQVQPEGFADIHVQLTRHGPDEPLHYAVSLDLKGRASFEYEAVPLRLTKVWGRVHFESGMRFPRFERVSGKVTGGAFRLDGTLRAGGEERLEIGLSGEILGPTVQHAMARSRLEILRETGSVLKDYDPRGNVEATIELEGLGKVRPEVHVRFNGARITGPVLPLQLSRVTGGIHYDGRHLHYRNLVGWYGQGWVQVNGEERREGPAAFRRLEIEGQDLNWPPVTVPREGPLATLEPYLRALKPRGLIKKLAFELDTRDPVHTPSVAMTIQNLELAPAETLIDRQPIPRGSLPPIRVEQAQLFVDPTEGLNIKGARGTVDRTIVTRLNLKRRREPPDDVVSLSCQVEECGPDCPLITYLGRSIQDYLKPFEATGRFAFNPLHLEVRTSEERGTRVTFPGPVPTRIRLDKLTACVGPRLHEVTGTLEIAPLSCVQTGAAGVAATQVKARLEGLDLGILDLRIHDLRGQLMLEGEARGPGQWLFLRLSKLNGRLYGGQLGPEGDLEVLLAPPYPFRGSLAVQDAQVQNLVADLTGSDPARTGITGLLRGQIDFESRSSRIEDLVGVGRAEVTEGKFGSVPAFVTFFNYFNSHINALETNHFEIQNREIHLGVSRPVISRDHPIWRGHARPAKSPFFRVEGDAITLLGSGKINFGGEMDLRFQTRELGLSTPIPGIRQAFNLLFRQLGEIYVLGTIERIDVQPVFLGIGSPHKGDKQPLRISDRALWPSERW